MAQSYPYIFLTLAWDSGVGFIGLTICAASAGIADWAGGAAGCCGAPAESKSAGRMNKGFSIRASCSCIAERHLMLQASGWEALSSGGNLPPISRGRTAVARQDP